MTTDGLPNSAPLNEGFGEAASFIAASEMRPPVPGFTAVLNTQGKPFGVFVYDLQDIASITVNETNTACVMRFKSTVEPFEIQQSRENVDALLGRYEWILLNPAKAEAAPVSEA